MKNCLLHLTKVCLNMYIYTQYNGMASCQFMVNIRLNCACLVASCVHTVPACYYSRFRCFKPVYCGFSRSHCWENWTEPI